MILFFSGTGNTRYCAELLAKALGDKAFDISPRRRDESISHVAASSRIVWMFPIYSWGVPPIVVDFMRHAVAATGCGTCMRTCPMYNISMKDGKPLWGNNCAMCLACYHRCPAHAVMYGHTTRHKGQYRGPLST